MDAIPLTLTIVYNNQAVSFEVSGNPAGHLCITCSHPYFNQRFNGGTKCFDDFSNAAFLPDLSDTHYLFFFDMKEAIMKETRNV